MKQDQLDIMITLVPQQDSGASEKNVHQYTVSIDNQVYISKKIIENKFADSFTVNLTANLDSGNHVLKIHYTNTEAKGCLQIQNIFVSGNVSGINLDSLVCRESLVSYWVGRVERNTDVIECHGTYQFKFSSPFFYWVLSKLPI